MATLARSPVLRRFAAVAGVVVTYAVLYRLVVATSSFSASLGTPFWPPAGFTVAVLLLRPRREWPGYLAAVFATETTLDWDAGFGLWASPFMGLANTAEPLLAALLLQRLLGKAAPDLSQLRDLGLFLASAAVAGPLVAAVIGSVGPWLVASDAIWPRLPRWYVGDALGVIAIAPLIITGVRMRGERTPWNASWTLIPFTVGAAVALGPWDFPARLSLPYLVIPALALVAIKMGTRAAAACVLAVAVLVETTTAVGSGPFSVEGAFHGLVGAQMYLATCALSALAIAALMSGYVSRGELALRDQLTGLANRRLLYDRIAVACRQLRRRAGHVGLLYVDLDGFKQVNDNFGHEAGDKVLIAAAERLRAAVRDEDTVARLGGDEFAVLLAHVVDPRVLSELAERLEASLAEPVVIPQGVARVGASVGSAWTAHTDEVPEVLLAQADHAMYALKRGRMERAQFAPLAPADGQPARRPG